MDRPWGGWEFHESFTERLEQLRILCLETDPLPEELLEVYKHVDDNLKDSSVEFQEQENIEPYFKEQGLDEATSTIAPSQEPGINSLIVHIEDGNLDKNGLETLRKVTARQFEFIVSKLSDPGILYLIESICTLGSSTLASLLCSEFLFQQFCDEKQCPRSIVLSAKKVVECFPQEACIQFLGPLLLRPMVAHQTIMAPFLSCLSPQQTLTLLRFLADCVVHLTESQAVVMNGLLTPLTDEQLCAKLISLLVESASDLRHSAKFGQLLVTTIQKLGPLATEQQKQQLAIVVMEHKTVARKVAERALKALD